MSISPNVYTKIIDLSNYVSEVPSSTGLFVGLTKKGRDNQLLFVGNRQEFIAEWGEPNINDFGASFSQGPYEMYNFLGESGSAYWMRCLPDDAKYATLKLSLTFTGTDSTGTFVVSQVDNINSLVDITSEVTTSDSSTFPIGMFYPIGRGEYYNGIYGIRITPYSNPLLSSIYVLDIYEKQSDGTDVIIETFNVAFDPNEKDESGASLFISDILEKYSTTFRFQMIKTNGEFSDGYTKFFRKYTTNKGNITFDPTTYMISDDKQNFTQYETNAGYASYAIHIFDSRGLLIEGWLADSTAVDTINIVGQRLVSGGAGFVTDSTSFDSTSGDITYYITKCIGDPTSPFSASTPIPFLYGSDGNIIDSSTGDPNSANIINTLSDAFNGILTNPVTSDLEDNILDTENYYFNLVFGCGYPTTVKNQISTLVQTRRDCIAILDNGDNVSVTASLTARSNDHKYNNYFTALYEPYSKVYDTFTGRDIWFSPTYHMSYIIPRNDRISEIWYAAAGFNRASIDSILETRFNPKQGHRDQLYLKQINPIVKFAPGYVVWSQLTSQAKASALQDINIVRVVLYVKRAIEEFAKFYIFEQNDAITWGSVANGVTLFLDDIKKRRGLDSYGVEVSATEYEKKRKTFHIDVILQPTRTSEKINLNIFVK